MTNDFLKLAAQNLIIYDAFIKCDGILKTHKNIAMSISGGKDSDIVLDIVHKLDKEKKCRYIFFDTGIEYRATKEHLKYLEQKYNIKIERFRPKKSVIKSCQEHGQPLLSKYVSEMISRLQKHGFKWEDQSFEELILKYPKCKVAIGWWTNYHKSDQFNIRRNKGLKEFILKKNGVDFKVSVKCCDYAKKNVSKNFVKQNSIDLMITGIRKAEGGIRSSAYRTCYDEKGHYRPIFWFKNSDIEEYEKIFDIKHSDCYEVYGLKRTGCAGCPFVKNLKQELEVIEEFEKSLSFAVNRCFEKSYEFTKKYKAEYRSL
ncbi:phosphoadenosine phosphosulfate reductase [Lachnospiraceae bacterium oral taxon 500]|nr:phosphoadenosine phosphosulfate reductase [Lachnospiraceae bacterium oral taxon 500]